VLSRWDINKDFKIPSTLGDRSPTSRLYRISFVVNGVGIIPLQQCVDVSTENAQDSCRELASARSSRNCRTIRNDKSPSIRCTLAFRVP